MTVRASMLFSYVSGNFRAGGWSESWYLPGALLSGIQGDQIDRIAKKRAGLLPSSIVISGYRLTEIAADNIGSVKSMSVAANWPGVRAADPQDVPQMATQCICYGAAVNNYKRFDLRGLPDGLAVNGAFQDDGAYGRTFGTFIDQIIAQGGQFRAVDLSQPKVGIASINALGEFEVTGPMAFAVGSYITLFRVRTVTGLKVKGTFYVKAKADATHGTFLNWSAGLVGQSGKMRVRVYIFPTLRIGASVIESLAVRKVGRPSKSYRGRASATR